MADISSEMQKLAALQERRLVHELVTILNQIGADEKLLNAIQGAIKRRDLAGAVALVPFDKLSAELEANVGQRLIDTVGQAAQLADLPEKNALQMRFDITNPETLSYIKDMSVSEVLRITQETREAVRDAICRGFTEGRHPYDIARELRDRIGLTSNQWVTVENYERFLDTLRERDSLAGLGDTAMQKLKRGGYRGKNPLNLQLSEERKQSLLQNYVTRLRNERCETIARTLVIDASNAGQNDAWKQAVDQGYLDEALWDVVWIAAKDERTCPTCGRLHNMRRPLSGIYIDNSPRPPRHPRCRCSEGLVRKSSTKQLLPLHAKVAMVA